MRKIRVSVAYRFMPPKDLAAFGSKVVEGLTENSSQFPAPPIDVPTMTFAVSDYTNKRNLYKNGGANQKAAYLQAKTKLIDVLDRTAVYVDEIANGNETIILYSGFVPTKGSRTPSPSPTEATGVSLRNIGAQRLEAQCDVQPVVSTYLCILTEGAPLPENIHITKSGQMHFGLEKAETPEDRAALLNAMAQITNVWIDLTKGRIKTFAGLTPTKRYFVTFCAINPTGVGALSPAVSTICL